MNIVFSTSIIGARNEQSLTAALEYLNLPKANDPELGERFLVQLAASAMTGSQMEKISSATVSSGEIVNAILQRTLTPKWKSEKLKLTALLILGTLLRAHLTNPDPNLQQDSDIVVRNVLYFFKDLL